MNQTEKHSSKNSVSNFINNESSDINSPGGSEPSPTLRSN